MITARDISYGFYSAWRFARLDRGAMQFVDNSITGFWKSFFAAVIIAPAYLLIMVLAYTGTATPPRAGLIEIAIVEAAGYVMAWVAFPLAMVTVCDLLQRGERYLGYIVAYNWWQVLQTAVVLPVILLITAGGQAMDEPHPIRTLLFFAIAFYAWFITRTALSISGWAAAGVVAIIFVLDAGIEVISKSLLF